MKFIDTRYGSLCVPDAAGDLIGRFLSTYGEWAHDEVRFVASALPKKPVRVLDVGSFVGTFGMGLIAEAEVASITFIEANPIVAEALRSNVKNLVNIPATVIEAAVSPDGKEMKGRFDEDNLGSLSFAETQEKGRAAIAAITKFVKLSDVVREKGGFDLIKMDVEGLERLILESEPSLMSPEGPSFWLECNEEPGVLGLVDLLISAGLSVHYFAFPAFSPNNFRGQEDQIFPWAYESGLWASRGDAPTLSATLVKHQCILKAINSREDLRLALWQTPRWGRREWQDATPSTLVAEAGHLVRGETYDDFLKALPLSPRPSVHELQIAMEALRGELRATQTILGDVELQLTQAKANARALDAGRAVAEQFEVALSLMKSKLDAIENSTYWRVGKRARNFFSRHPKLKNAVRFVLARVYRAIAAAK
ncbi:FkbM family methyltransferase [Variovorax paradoxus]|uniref:FkbM family methyltransferase n=1 Tax=Variovorax atrisoli TaxID=3394203 RepID=UPI00119A3C08|nr:FkbM family methyltransferase [Variovorax paradoxus]MDR6523772.1 FkbM family methyltransferase [Variovorax paradoxus]